MDRIANVRELIMVSSVTNKNIKVFLSIIFVFFFFLIESFLWKGFVECDCSRKFRCS